MYKDDVNVVLKDNGEELRALYFDYLIVYMKMQLYLPNLIDEREKLSCLFQHYFHTVKNETEVLKVIKKKYGKVEEDELIDELLDEFEEMYDARWSYYQDVLLDYESVVEEYDNFIEMLKGRFLAFKKGESYSPYVSIRYRMHRQEPDFQLFDDEYKKHVLEKINKK